MNGPPAAGAGSVTSHCPAASALVAAVSAPSATRIGSAGAALPDSRTGRPCCTTM
jgi:hypothetical protein